MIYVANLEDENQRIDKVLSQVVEGVSRTKLQTLIKNGTIKVNGNEIKTSYLLKEDDRIDIEQEVVEKVKIEPENIPIEVVWEDENMLVVNKPSGMLTHPTPLETSGTLVNALLYMYGQNLSDVNGDFRRGILHRLDRNTSGLLMIAKNNETHRFLAEQIKSRSITKKYRAIVKGVIEQDSGVIDLPVGRNPKQPYKMSVRPIPYGKNSITIYNVVKRFKEVTAVELTLVTGRTHQIRVHMSHMGHPLYNDTLYGAGQGKVKTEEQVLQSYLLGFTKPFSDEIITIEIPPDEKYIKVLKYFEGRE